jgi:hypothetical protein
MTFVVGVGDTLVESSKQCNPRTIGPKDSNGPSPLEGNGIKLQTSHKGFAFDAFQLLKNYDNNVGLDLAMGLAIDSNNFCFMILLTTQTTNTTQGRCNKSQYQNLNPNKT